jgi:hypothetical protein
MELRIYASGKNGCARLNKEFQTSLGIRSRRLEWMEMDP